MICGDMASNPHNFWSYIKSKRCDNTGVASLLSYVKLHNDNISTTRPLNKQFSPEFTRANTSGLPHFGPSPNPYIQQFELTEEGVLKLLNNLNHHKASRPHNIPGRFQCAEHPERSLRLGPRSGKGGWPRQRTIIGSFCRECLRDAVFKARFNLKAYNTEHHKDRVFVKEDLTASSAMLANSNFQNSVPRPMV